MGGDKVRSGKPNCHFAEMARKKNTGQKSPKKAPRQTKKAASCLPVSKDGIPKNLKAKDAIAMAKSLALELMEARKTIAAKGKDKVSNLADDDDDDETVIDAREEELEEEEEEEEEDPTKKSKSKIKSKITHSKLAGRGLKAKRRLDVENEDEEYAAWKKARSSGGLAMMGVTQPVIVKSESADAIAK